MTATSTFHRLGLFTALMTAVSGCSSQEFLAGAQGRLNQPKVNVESQSSNSGQSVSEKELESDRENPPVEVAGANLVGDCFFLSDGPPDAQDGAVECTMSGSNSEPMMIVARSPHLHMGTQDAAPVDGTLLGFRGPNPNSFLVSDAEPLRAHFTVSKNEIAALSSAEIMLSFDQLNVEGGVRAISSTMKMKVHKKKVNPNATCAFGVKMTRSDFVSPATSYFSQVGFAGFVFNATAGTQIAGCDFALEFTGSDFKSGTSGLVFIVDSTTRRRTLLFNNFPSFPTPPPGFPSSSVEATKQAQCANKPNDIGKWLCSDYLSIFAEDLMSGQKHIEVFGLSSGFDPNLQFKK